MPLLRKWQAQSFYLHKPLFLSIYGCEKPKLLLDLVSLRAFTVLLLDWLLSKQSEWSYRRSFPMFFLEKLGWAKKTLSQKHKDLTLVIDLSNPPPVLQTSAAIPTTSFCYTRSSSAKYISWCRSISSGTCSKKSWIIKAYTKPALELWAKAQNIRAEKLKES